MSRPESILIGHWRCEGIAGLTRGLVPRQETLGL
jgi:hypothetical protein